MVTQMAMTREGTSSPYAIGASNIGSKAIAANVLI
jgi:hypothetical protein